MPAHIRQVGAGSTLTGLYPLVPRVRPWPCLPSPRRLAVSTRPVVVGLLAALTGVPRIGLPPASSGSYDSLTMESFQLHSATQSLVAHRPVVEVGDDGVELMHRRPALSSIPWGSAGVEAR